MAKDGRDGDAEDTRAAAKPPLAEKKGNGTKGSHTRLPRDKRGRPRTAATGTRGGGETAACGEGGVRDEGQAYTAATGQEGGEGLIFGGDCQEILGFYDKRKQIIWRLDKIMLYLQRIP